MILKKKTYEAGQSLYEVLFSIVIASIVLIGIVSLAAKNVRNSDYSSNNALATKYAQEGSEWIRQYRDNSWADFKIRSSGGGSTWCINTLPYPPPAWGLPSGCGTATIAGTVFGREMILTNDATDPGIVNVEITVEWNDAQGIHTVRSLTSLSDWNR